jgi:insertion element IS1 protein InsB
LFCTDDFGPYGQLIPKRQLIQGKAGTYTVEQHNSDTRHWLARFRRKRKVVSKTARAAEEGIKLVEFLHRNNGLQQLQAHYLPLFT